MALKRHFSLIILGLIILLATVTRIYKLGIAPAGLYVDEAGQGYSAYSILKTGKDEFGKPFPIVFRSLTDFKTPVYIYLIAPLIPVFGLNAFTVRFPSFLFSILTIPILYLLVKRLSGNVLLSLLTVALLSISPWHVLFGRTNFECNVALFFFLSGVLAFYESLKKPKFLLLSALMFAIAIPAYHSQRIITPLVLLILTIKYQRIIFDRVHRIYLIGGILIGLLISLPTLSIALTPGFLARAAGLNIFTNPGANGSLFYTTREFFGLYFSYFSPRFMFSLGDYGPRSSFPELATFFLWQFPFYIWGLWTLMKEKNQRELKFFTIITLLISPIPAAVTRDPYITIRALPLVIPQIIIVSLGIINIYQHLKTKQLRIASLIIFAALIFYSILKLYSSVIILNEFYRAKYWDYGWEEAANVIKTLDQNLPITIDNARSDPDLQIAFFLKYGPIKYQKENFEVPLSEYYTNLYRNKEKYVGQVVTRPINWERDLVIDQYLIGDELGISLQQIQEHKLELISEVNYPDGTPAFRIVKTNPIWEKAQKKDTLKAPPKDMQ
jgi:4-amino-4-deoxy-L-arabinose transferase-like glycosyltransferase